MSDNVQLPALGESVTEGTVTRWLKNVGDTVAVDEPLLEISTDKVDTEIPSPFAGVLEQILVEEDETAEVGAVLAVIGDGAGTSGEAPTAEPAPAPAPTPEPAPAPAPDPVVEPIAAVTAEPATPTQEAPVGDGQAVTLPALGESVTEGTVTRWLKSVGDTVAVDEPLLEISTDKVDTEVPSPFAGVLEQILVGEDETVDVGAALAMIGSGAADSAAPASSTTPAQSAPPAPTPEAATVPPPASPIPAVAAPVLPAASAATPDSTLTTADTPKPQAAGSYLTPLVRKLAAEQGVDTATLVGSGVGGRIRKEDVLEAAAQAAAAKAAAEAAAAKPVAAAPTESAASTPTATTQPQEVSPLRGTTEKASRLRQVIAERMVEALHSQAQLTTVVEVDVTRVARLRTAAKASFAAREGVNLTFLPFFVLAAVEALKVHPKINGVLEGKEITYHGTENVGVAVDTDRGLVVPVIRNAGDLNLAGIARKINDLAGRTRAGQVTPDELSGGTFTVTNTGSGGALFDTPIVPGGTSAILGTGTIAKRPVVVKDEDGGEVIAIRSMCYLALSYDHRLVDGADASRYLKAVKQRIEEGAFEAEVGM